MNTIDLHAFVTVFLFFVFIAIVAWVIAERKAKEFKESSDLPVTLEKYRIKSDGK